MSQDFVEGQLTFSFPDDWLVCRPESASFYKRHFQSFSGGCKEIDFLVYNPNSRELWFIEVKDYRTNIHTKPLDLADEIAIKTRDVLAMLPIAKLRDNAASTASILQVGDFWKGAYRADSLRIVLHCEFPTKPSRLFPDKIDQANLQTKLRQKLRSVDPHAVFTNRQLGHPLPWDVA